MKLVRFGEPGREKPGAIDSQGALRDLSGVVDDIAGEHLLPEGIARLRALDLTRCRGSTALHREWGPAWVAWASSSASA